MRGEFVKKLLALSLSAAMMLGNLVPAYAVEETLTEETRTKAPSISLDVMDDDSVDGFYVQNNDDEYSCINCTILPKEIIEAGEVEDVNFHSSVWVESGETIWEYIGDYVVHNIEKNGEYFFVANAENDNEAKSELTVLEDYPIIATVENMEEAFEYQIAESSGYVYFPGKSPDEYTYAEVFLTVTDEWGNTATWSTSLGERMEIYALSTEELSREYATWTFDKIEFHKFNPTAWDCFVTKEIYTSLTEGEPFEEVQTEIPTIMVEKDDNGMITSIKVQNNDELESWVWYGLATREQIEEDNLNCNGIWLDSLATTMDLYLPSLIDDFMRESGEYYFVSYAENESELRSELAVLEGEPIRITESVMEDTALYQVGDVSGDFYFVGNPVEDYSRGSIAILIDEEWTDYRDLDEKNGFYYLNAEAFNEGYGEWTIKQVKFYKASANETGQLIETFIYPNVAEDGTFEEPKAAAPTLALHKDRAGNVIGVAITNNLPHDDGEIKYGYYGESDSNTSWSYVDAGETRIILFDELQFPTSDAGEETFTFQCSVYDYANRIWSDTVTLDYPITLETEEYSGENIIVYVETNEEGRKWYYVDVNQLPEEFSKWYGFNSEEMMEEGHRRKRNFTKSDDDTHWMIEDSYGFDLTSMKAEKIVANEESLKFTYCHIPEEKITLEEREFSSKEVLLLDYDYYNAFIASGGTITVNSNSEVEVSTDNFISEDKWTLEYLYQEFTGTGIYTLIKNIANSVKFWANQYWVDETGSFSAINYYDLDGNIIAEDSILKHDVVLIEYAPEIVWVDSVELTVPETMEKNETAMATVVLDAGQDKYPFGREPQIRYESNNPEVVAVDAETGELTAGTVDGIAKITVYADEDLRAQQGDTNIVTDSVEIAVGDYQEVLLLDYDYYNAFIASGGSITIDANGEVEVSTENFTSDEKWSLEYLYKKFADQIDTVIETLADEVKEWANKYWKSEVGSFKAVNYYDTEGNSIAKDEVSKHDIVLIEYAPEIVWVDSMEITAPEKMEKNETGNVAVALDAGQDKYPFGREPQLRYASSNPNVLEVDAKTGALTAKDVDGIAYITVYADEDLRAEEGLDALAERVQITVGEGALDGGVIDGIVWSIDKTGQLIVTGNGDINLDMPWDAYKDDIVSAYINVEGMTTLQGVFMNYTALKEVDFANSDTSELTVLWNAFNGCSSLTKVNMSSFDTSQVRDMDWMFYGCSSLEKLDLSNFDLSSLVCNWDWFGECYALKEIKAPINYSMNMDLPVLEDDKWYLEDGTEITILPQNLSESVTLYKNEIPKAEEPKPPVTETFNDVKPGEWYVEEIQYVFNKGMMSGVDGETFMPDEPVNRAMVVQTLYKNEGRPEVTDFTKYDVLKDINRHQWWANGVAWGMNHGIVKGYSDTMTFKPENSVTREDLATFLFRYARDVRKVDVTLSRSADAILGDAPVNSWAREAFAWAIDKGLIKGITKTDSNGNTYYDLSPETGATRAQMATILMRFCEKYNI